MIAGLLALTAPPPAAATNYQPADQILVNHFVSLESGLLHITPVSPVTVIESSGRVYGKVNGKTVPAYAVTNPIGAAGDPNGPVVRCTITVGSDAHRFPVDPTKPPGPHNPTSKDLGYINEELKTLFAHEVFHCLSAKLAGTIANLDRHGAWLIEGAATWVASDLVADSLLPRDAWLTYLESPMTPLFRRAEDAIGFFGHLAHSHISPWSVFGPMFAATSDTAAYDVALGSETTFLDSEASAFFDAGGYGSAWVPRGQGSPTADSNVPSHSTSLSKQGPTAHHTETLVVPADADGPYALTLKAPKTQLAVLSGVVRLHATSGGSSVDEVNPGDVTLCKSGGRSCDCPGTHLTFPRGDIAISGGPQGGKVELIGMSDCPAIPARTCAELLTLHDFPGAATEQSTTINTFSTCGFFRPEPPDTAPPPPPSDLAGGLVVDTLPSATVAHKYFVMQCPFCTAFAGVGDEAHLRSAREEEDIGYFYTAAILSARIDNDVVTVTAVPGTGDTVTTLLRRVIAELLATRK